jgi:hypothetical protein
MRSQNTADKPHQAHRMAARLHGCIYDPAMRASNPRLKTLQPLVGAAEGLHEVLPLSYS